MGYSGKRKGNKLLTSTTNQAKVVLVSHFRDLVQFGETSFAKRQNIFNVGKKYRHENILITFFPN